ncbi:hypothetical protein N9W61_02655, partial [Algibacter sp.]|nr:hypothetical protein [Algibacter sp.]
MKTKLLLLCIFFNFYTHAQLRLIKQTENNVYGSNITGLKTLNNDIIFAMTESGSPYKRGAYVSNGSSETTNLIQGLENNRYDFEGLDKENYVIDNDVFLFSSRGYNYQTEDKAYVLNDGRTSANLVTSSTYLEKITRTSNNKIIKLIREYYEKYTLAGVTYPDGFFFHLSIYNADGVLENNYTYDGNTGVNSAVEQYNSLVRIHKIFYWNGTYYFIGENTQNRSDLYKFAGGRPYRVTQLYANGTSNTDVSINHILFEESYMYFQGLYRTWGVTDGPLDFVSEGLELCYTNGNGSFGANQTQIPLFILGENKENYDGTTGYMAKETSEVSPARSRPIKELNNGSVIYMDDNIDALGIINLDGSYDYLVNNTKEIDEYFSYKDKFYYINLIYNSDNTQTCYLYEIDGDPLNTIVHEFPTGTDGGNFSYALRNKFDVSEEEGKAYFIGAYYPSGGVQAAILSFDFETSQFTKEKVFDYNEISGYINNINRFNNGFVFSDSDKVYSYDVDIRAKYIKPNENSKSANTAKTSSIEDITYNNNIYNVGLETTDLAPDETLKIELLDTTSMDFKTKIGSLPNSSYAKTYYKLVTLNESNHQSTIS